MANRNIMINICTFLLTISTTVISFPAICQYYYKDLVTTKQINETYRIYKANKISNVELKSFQGNVAVTEGFVCRQQVNLARNQVITYTKTADAGESFFTAFYNAAGLLIKTVDSTEESVSVSEYGYDADYRLSRLTYLTRANDSSSSTNESHFWQYSTSGKPQRMLRIKNGNDTTIVSFALDEKGNIAEEQASRKGAVPAKVYYYYDEKNQLTDIVRYSARAKRLLPDYIFEYEENGELSTMTIVPEGSSDYQKWYYKYDDSGLKLIEFCYNKKAELLGKVEYDYTSSRRP